MNRLGLAKSETELAERASRFIKAELQKADVTYEELAERLKKHGLKGETLDSDQGKVEARNIPGDVFIGCGCCARIGCNLIGRYLIF